MAVGLVFSELLYIMFILIVIILLYFIFRDIEKFNIYTKEVQVEADPVKTLDIVYESLRQRGYVVNKMDNGVVISFAGVKYEIRYVTLPSSSIIVKIDIMKFSILIGAILFLICVFGWLLLALWALIVYDRYNKILDIIYISKESVKQ